MGGGRSESTESPGLSDLHRSDSAKSKHYNPNFEGQSSLKSDLISSPEEKESAAADDGEQHQVPLENQQTASTESDGRDGPTEEFRERKSSFKKLGDGVRRLLRRVSKNIMEM